MNNLWVNTNERLPEQTKRPVLYIVKWYDDKMYVRTMTANQLADVAKRNLIDYLWLDESGTTSNKDEAVEFAEWVRDNTVPDGAPKLFYKPDISRYTIRQLYGLWQQSKNKQ